MIWQLLKWLTFGELMQPRIDRPEPSDADPEEPWIFGDGGVIYEDETED
jgi:hypothetical protein